jgi:hypothetical protein
VRLGLFYDLSSFHVMSFQCTLHPFFLFPRERYTASLHLTGQTIPGTHPQLRFSLPLVSDDELMSH